MGNLSLRGASRSPRHASPTRTPYPAYHHAGGPYRASCDDVRSPSFAGMAVSAPPTPSGQRWSGAERRSRQARAPVGLAEWHPKAPRAKISPFTMEYAHCLSLGCHCVRESVNLVVSHGRWKRPCVQTAHMRI